MIIDGVDLKIEEGKIIVFIGVNGCGKLIIFKLFVRLMVLKSGMVLLEGKDIYC